MWSKIGHMKQSRMSYGIQSYHDIDSPVSSPQKGASSYGAYTTTNDRMFRAKGTYRRPCVAAGIRILGYTEHSRKRGAMTVAPVPSRKALISNRRTHEDGILLRQSEFNNKYVPSKQGPTVAGGSSNRFRRKGYIGFAAGNQCRNRDSIRPNKKFGGGFTVAHRTDTCPWTR
mmetsp:Transcript_18746/g.26390  ORF Transcript_18746/g.26390 Transcript_18746/m.26390 type:complete len:172 (-) Transcript_18746:220-735(-)